MPDSKPTASKLVLTVAFLASVHLAPLEAQPSVVDVVDWKDLKNHYDSQEPLASTLYRLKPTGEPNGEGKIELRIPDSEDSFLRFDHDEDIHVDIRVPINTVTLPESDGEYSFAVIDSGAVSISGPDSPAGGEIEFPEFTGFSSDHRGGAVIRVTGDFGSVSLANLLMEDNESGGDGGAINQLGGTLNLSHVYFRGNSAEGNGGAVSSTGNSIYNPDHTSYIFNVSNWNGGGLYSQSDLAEIFDNFFFGNHSADRGGNFEFSGSGSLYFNNNIVLEGIGDIRGDGLTIDVASGGHFQLQNNIIFGNNSCNPLSAVYRPGSDFSFNWADNNGGPYFTTIFEGSGGMTFGNLFSSRSSLPARFGSGNSDSQFNAEAADQASTQLSLIDQLYARFSGTVNFDETAGSSLTRQNLFLESENWQFRAELRDRLPVFIWEGPEPENGSPEYSSGNIKALSQEDITDNCPLTDLNGLARPQDGDGDGIPACDTGPFEHQNGADLGTGQSGAFFDIRRDGEGIFVQMLGDGRAIVYLFSYTPEGEQMWLVGVGEVNGNSLLFEEMLLPAGPSFGPDYDPALLTFADWGAMSAHWPSCGAPTSDPGVMTFQSSDEAYGKARMYSTRLTQPVACPGGDQHENAGWSGNYYLPEENGHGIVVEILPNGTVVMIWYLFDDDGNPAWVLGVGQLNGNVAEINDLRMPTGAKWGAAFDPADVVQNEWGSATLTFACGSMVADYDGIQGARTLNLIQLIALGGTSCTE